MNEEFVKKVIQGIESLDNIPNKQQDHFAFSLLLREVLMLYDEMGVIEDVLSDLVSAIYDLGEHLKP